MVSKFYSSPQKESLFLKEMADYKAGPRKVSYKLEHFVAQGNMEKEKNIKTNLTGFHCLNV